MTIIWVDGNWQDDKTPAFSIHDRLRLGECVFATILCRSGKLVHGDLHIEKLARHLSVMHFEMPYSTDELLRFSEDVLQQNGLTGEPAALNIYVTGGVSGNGIKRAEKPALNTVIRALPAPKTPDSLHVVIAKNVRRNEGSPLSQIKCANYGENILAALEAEERGADDAVLLNNAGRISTGTIASIFAVLDGRLCTPPLAEGAQSGVTRKLLLDYYDGQECPLTPEDLRTAEGVFMANSLRGAVPVTHLDDTALMPPALEIPRDFHYR